MGEEEAEILANYSTVHGLYEAPAGHLISDDSYPATCVISRGSAALRGLEISYIITVLRQ